MLFRLLSSLALVVLLTTSAWSEIRPEAFTLSPMIGGHVFEGDQDLDNDDLFSIGLGYNLTERAALEAVFSQTDADGDNAGDTDARIRTYRLDALYHFMTDNKLVPYLAVGLGEIETNPDQGETKEHLLVNAGAGIKYFLNETVALRADMRYLVEFPDPENNLLYSAGALFQFGGVKQAPAPVEIAEEPAPAPEPVVQEEPPAEPQPVDSDGDGVYDDQDQCPNTPKGAPVNSVGCPLDTDGDGVYDYMDQCPNTPKGAPVNSVGCPLDTDGDGVYDYMDKCPNTPRGVSVDADGCPTKLSLKINFGHDSDKIGPEYDAEIAKAAECINNYPGNKVNIEGHTDSRGAAAYNQQLSERRAKAVLNRLVEKFNIPASRMSARGFGETKPIADNATAEGRFENRRVDVACGATN
ncbi:OmpA-OmpF porin, OOP family [Malonomonas rubra DSM 5091]|uniref:OmpA-OmpF porin, OOP family n=1 Tax=Malonomonas rubra DSM 5091 TaxID=1122189 RepID=A0A1M6BG87_MALRU|nr:OmpA family protein [Malonomonas rubra]SHI47754.1 OmpA-OmpF porin, OOP family [Malonomonas rubra DSM 5091]